MFLIYINDFVSLLTQYGIKVKLFANDIKLYIKIVNHVNCYKLPLALSAICKWSLKIVTVDRAHTSSY